MFRRVDVGTRRKRMMHRVGRGAATERRIGWRLDVLLFFLRLATCSARRSSLHLLRTAGWAQMTAGATTELRLARSLTRGWASPSGRRTCAGWAGVFVMLWRLAMAGRAAYTLLAADGAASSSKLPPTSPLGEHPGAWTPLRFSCGGCARRGILALRGADAGFRRRPVRCAASLLACSAAPRHRWPGCSCVHAKAEGLPGPPGPVSTCWHGSSGCRVPLSDCRSLP